MHLPGWVWSYLGLLAEVGREFEAGDGALVIAHDDDGVDGVELDMCQHGLLPGHHHLLADGLVLVDAQVEHVHLQVVGFILFVLLRILWMCFFPFLLY